MKYKIKQLSIETSRYLNLSKRTVHKYEQRINDIKDTNKHLEKTGTYVFKTESSRIRKMKFLKY